MECDISYSAAKVKQRIETKKQQRMKLKYPMNYIVSTLT